MSERPVRLIELDDAARTTIQDKLQQRQLTPRVRERLEMVKAADLGHDLPFDVWTSARLSASLRERTTVAVSPGWIRALLARQRCACGRPKHTLAHLQDADAVARCAAELAQVGGKGGSRA